MRPHPRIRKTIKWGGAAVTVLLLIAWLASIWRSFGVSTPAGGSVSVRFGMLNFDGPMFGAGSRGGQWYWGREHNPYPFQWTLYRGTEQSMNPPGAIYDDVGIPIWWLWGSTLLLAASAWGLDAIARRRARLNLCPKCNYDRAGIAGDAKCPECGRVPA
jgi:hypothetical protein